MFFFYYQVQNTLKAMNHKQKIFYSKYANHLQKVFFNIFFSLRSYIQQKRPKKYTSLTRISRTFLYKLRSENHYVFPQLLRWMSSAQYSCHFIRLLQMLTRNIVSEKRKLFHLSYEIEILLHLEQHFFIYDAKEYLLNLFSKHYCIM